MSWVGKVLIVIQVVMSICFMAFAGAVYVAHENWKTRFEDGQQRIAQLEKDKADADVNLSRARDEADKSVRQLTTERDDWKTKFIDSEVRIQDLTSRLNNLNTNLERQTALAVAKGIEADNREKETEVLRKQNTDLQKRLDEANAELNTTRDVVFNTEVQLRQIQDRFDKLQVVRAFLEKIVKRYNLPTDPAIVEGMETPPPLVEGLVEEVQKGKTNRTQFVVITIGEDDGLRVGNVLEVLRIDPRKSLYLGQVRVIDVEADRAVCEVIKAGDIGDIEVGDNVTTRL